MPLFLGLPETQPGFDRPDVEYIRDQILGFEPAPLEISELYLANEGHAASLAALNSGFRRIADGSIDACLVGGVDSYLHVDTMDWLDTNRQLSGSDARSAFVPGEGAGFCLLIVRSCRRVWVSHHWREFDPARSIAKRS